MPPRTGSRTEVPKLGRPTGKDVVAGFVTGLFSIPEGMAYASIGGFNPVLGLYSGMAPTLVGAVFARTVLMTTTLTSAIALSSQSVLAQAGLDPTAPGNIATLTLMVGIVMTLFGLFRLGSVMSFVSTAVMTGFTTGIALQIIAGVLKDATAYASQQHNTLLKIGDWAIHIQRWDPASTLVAAGTIAVWALARLVRPLKAMATLIALAVVTVVVVAAGIDAESVGDIASIPNALPHPVLPDLAAAPHLITGAIAVALVGLAQAAGIGAAVPNPDGSRTNVSGDFLAQGLANLAGGVTQSLPTGGSLSRTGVATSAGARTRWSNIFAGAWLALIVLLVGKQAELIPMPVIGGLVMLIGIELITGRRKDIVLVLRTAPLSAVAMIVTFLATTALPLQRAGADRRALAERRHDSQRGGGARGANDPRRAVDHHDRGVLALGRSSARSGLQAGPRRRRSPTRRHTRSVRDSGSPRYRQHRPGHRRPARGARGRRRRRRGLAGGEGAGIRKRRRHGGRRPQLSGSLRKAS